MPSVASAERARLTSELVECFKIYDALKMWREAEDVVRRELVRPFIKKVRNTSTRQNFRSQISDQQHVNNRPYTPLR
jgi:hypothetical protein